MFLMHCILAAAIKLRSDKWTRPNSSTNFKVLAMTPNSQQARHAQSNPNDWDKKNDTL